jgi:formylglycine-generating enzyme required for sulfatase activity
MTDETAVGELLSQWERECAHGRDITPLELCGNRPELIPELQRRMQAMVVIPGPVEFLMGSPPTEVGRQDNEVQHNKRIGRTFAIAAKSVTVEEYRKFEYYAIPPKYTRTADLSVVGTSWFQGADGKGLDDIEDILSINMLDRRLLRGGSFASRALVVRSAYRDYVVPTTRNDFNGFRPARTLPLGSLTAPGPDR